MCVCDDDLPFSPRFISQTLDWVELLQWRVSGGIDKAKDENERNHCFRLARSLDFGRLVHVVYILAHFILLEIGGDKSADNSKDEDEKCRGNEELGSSTPFVGVDGAKDGAGKGHDVLHAVIEEASTAVCYPRATKHGWVVVGYRAVAGPLAEEGHGEDEHGAVAGFAGIEEFLVLRLAMMNGS
jgi:hypothetical protein